MTLRTLAISIIDAFKRAVGIRTRETTGLPDIGTGDQVNIDAAGDRFSGSAEVDPVSHEMGDSGYDTDIEAQRNDLGDR